MGKRTTTFWRVPAEEEGPPRGLRRRVDEEDPRFPGGTRIVNIAYWDSKRRGWVSAPYLGYHWHHGFGWEVDYEGVTQISREECARLIHLWGGTEDDPPARPDVPPGSVRGDESSGEAT